jgi:hypothetical protein
LEPTLFKFIWKYSNREQIVLLIAAISLFPLLYLSLELPRRIINDAIGARGENIDVPRFHSTCASAVWKPESFWPMRQQQLLTS